MVTPVKNNRTFAGLNLKWGDSHSRLDEQIAAAIEEQSRRTRILKRVATMKPIDQRELLLLVNTVHELLSCRSRYAESLDQVVNLSSHHVGTLDVLGDQISRFEKQMCELEDSMFGITPHAPSASEVQAIARAYSITPDLAETARWDDVRTLDFAHPHTTAGAIA